jgi:hypothetical protein
MSMTPSGFKPATCRFVAITPPRTPDVPVELRNKHLLDISPEKYLLSNFWYSGALAKLRRTTMNFVISVLFSVRPSIHTFTWNNSVTNERIFMKFDI